MRPHEYPDIYRTLRKLDPDVRNRFKTAESFYDMILDNLKPEHFMKNFRTGDGSERGVKRVQSQAVIESMWFAEGNPYYTVYPVAAHSLCQVSLDIPCDQVKLPSTAILLRFIEGKEPEVNGRKLRCILGGAVVVRTEKGRDDTAEIGLSVWCDYGEKAPEPDFSEIPLPIFDYMVFPLRKGMTVEEAIKSIPFDDPNPEADTDYISVRYLIGVGLLASDPSLITPDVLSKDRLKYEKTQDPSIVERAHRRGKIGWLVGAEWETMPHYRRPHFALRWTGKGRTVPKIVPVKGSIVHREILTEVPQGYMELDHAEKQD